MLGIVLFVPKINTYTLIGGYVAGLIAFILSLKLTGYVGQEDISMLRNLRSE